MSVVSLNIEYSTTEEYNIYNYKKIQYFCDMFDKKTIIFRTNRSIFDHYIQLA